MWKQWVAKDKMIKAKVAASVNYDTEHLHSALEAAIPKRYLDEHYGKGKNKTDIKVDVVWLPEGEATNVAKEIIVGTTTVGTHAHVHLQEGRRQPPGVQARARCDLQPDRGSQDAQSRERA